MRNFPRNTLVFFLFAALACQGANYATAAGKASPKATPPGQAQSNSDKSAANSSKSSATPQSSGQNNSPSGNSNGSNSNSSNSGSNPSNSNNSSQSTSQSSAQSNSQNTSTTNSVTTSQTAEAKASSNKKLDPTSVSSLRANSRAEKTSSTISRVSAACQTNTAKGKAQVASDPCSDFIVVFQPGLARSDSAALIKSANGQVKREFASIFNGAVVNGPLSKMQALANNPNVLVVEDDLDVTAFALQSLAPWGLDRIDQIALPLSNTFDNGDITGSNSYSYVVDTGIDATNQDFEGRVTSGFTAVLDGQGSADCNGHGTHVAGIIGGARYGVAKKTTLIPVRVLDCSGSGSYSSVISGLDWIAANHRAGDAAVVNLSLGGPASSTLDGAIKNLIAMGINVVVAAGNSNADACNYSPSRVTDAITVGATASTDERASYSNFGSCVDIFAPGSSITSTWLGTTGTNTISGTSMASPNIAGIVARFISVNAGLTPQQVANSLKKSAAQGVVINPGTNSPNALGYLNVVADTTSAPVDSSPTFQKVNPRGKVVAKK
jgi:subtilisin family serine protease